MLMKAYQNSTNLRGTVIMSRNMNIFIGISFIVVFLVGIILIVSLSTNDNYVHRDLLSKISEVNDKEYITSISIDCTRRPPGTDIEVRLLPELPDELIYTITVDLMENIDEYIYYDYAVVSGKVRGLIIDRVNLHVISTDQKFSISEILARNGSIKYINAGRRIKEKEGIPIEIWWSFTSNIEDFYGILKPYSHPLPENWRVFDEYISRRGEYNKRGFYIT